MSVGLSREIKKLEIRLEDYLKNEEEFVGYLKTVIKKFLELDKELEETETITDLKTIEKIKKLRVKAVRALCEAMKKDGEAEHEKSHLIESYSALILELEEEFKDI